MAFDRNDPFFSRSHPGPPPSVFGDFMAPPLTQVPAERHSQGAAGRSLALHHPFAWPFPGGMMMSPFSMFGDMERMMQMAPPTGVHSYSSSSVMHYSSGGAGEQPQVYQATSSTRQAPGGLKETRKSVKDSASGVQKMAIGHHIGDRSHTIERHYNAHTREKVQNQEFVNVDETNAGSFNDEWSEKTHSTSQGVRLAPPQRAIRAPGHAHSRHDAHEVTSESPSSRQRTHQESSFDSHAFSPSGHASIPSSHRQKTHRRSNVSGEVEDNFPAPPAHGRAGRSVQFDVPASSFEHSPQPRRHAHPYSSPMHFGGDGTAHRPGPVKGGTSRRDRKL